MTRCYARRVPLRTVLLATALLFGALAGEAAASNLVFVCGKELCSASADGRRPGPTHP